MHKDKQASPKPSERIRKFFPHEPTSDQDNFFGSMDKFLDKTAPSGATFILKGYAGTGKTTVLAALVKVLPSLGLRAVMLAPTGRAAKVMSTYADKTGYTIHKIIYRAKQGAAEGAESFTVQKNYYQKSVFIIDEASMLSDDRMSGKSLLADLIGFVFQNPENRLLLIGDIAQLPPVGSEDSPALDKNYLIRNYKLDVNEALLTIVTRQEQDSGILANATSLRNEVLNVKPKILFTSKGFKDFYRMTGERLEDGLRYAYDKFGLDNTMIITRSNKAAVQYNKYIRNSIFYYEDELSAGERLMIVKNNYTYMESSDKVSFLANGDFVEILKIRSFEELYGLRFATLELRLIDYPDEVPFEARVILDTLHSNKPALTFEEWKALYQQVAEDYQDLEQKSKIREAMSKDPYLNALQVKYAYTLTCHKSQGGQWDAVFVDQGYLNEEQIDKNYVRWLYTAMTRAKKELFMVNFHNNFFIK
ncbi:AAA family ATPase [uncultured Cyclobacterium sp.]|uniref:ATP-dependent DNA helicase n=1 Tax=uncultured Cyclobacterium sp. TaxID=453820 RepID=UPI0030EB289A|tara:strand:- start:51381 stop:52808 length:1428 start_codon:yes stop_codon:yes gene_type:complete